jgi:ribonuclease P protein component
MFSKQYRLPPGSFSQKPSIAITSLFSLRYAPNKLLFNRYGFVISKRIDKRATMRNHLKRKLRKILENEGASLKQGYDMLFIIQKPFVEGQEALGLLVKKVLGEEKLL